MARALPCFLIRGMMALEKELETFAAQKDELLRTHPGKFALIHGSDFLGAFDRAETAYHEGLKRFERGRFLVKLISGGDEGYREQVQSLQG